MRKHVFWGTSWPGSLAIIGRISEEQFFLLPSPFRVLGRSRQSTIRRTQKNSVVINGALISRKNLLFGAEKFCLLCPPTLLRASDAHTVGEKAHFSPRAKLFYVETFTHDEDAHFLVMEKCVPRYHRTFSRFRRTLSEPTWQHSLARPKRSRSEREREKCV